MLVLDEVDAVMYQRTKVVSRSIAFVLMGGKLFYLYQDITEKENRKMIIVMKSTASENDVKKVSGIVENLGLRVNVVNGATQSVIGIIGDTTKVDPESIEVDPAVEKVMHVSEPYKLANRAFHPEDSIIDVDGVKVGGNHLAIIAGPCSVESKEQVI